MIITRKSNSLTYQASRLESYKFVTPVELNFSKLNNTLKFFQIIQDAIGKLKEIEHPILINRNSPLILCFPHVENLNEPIIKLGVKNKFHFMLCPRFISLEHEFEHMLRIFRGLNIQFVDTPDPFSIIYNNLEEIAAIQV